ncbi:hypothetical protein GCM10027280_07040 [Micromonospora polyrhachis]|uniref:Excreted virulence factor EspC, type VII ESX diderm n=1 Tax=Micromonospora polyrhachis TaxID=1282883 RepID=A0A7W7SKB8_9ACTN|nr:hypothetical protein [Micromonospora polyrhachis]MBB4956384.1 hypothetical protein [Micromonospora polyrhachis]
MNAIDRNGDGVMDMLPDETRTHLKTVHNVGEEFEGTWRTALGVIDSTEIGGGPMGRKFMEGFEPNVKELRSILDKIPDDYRQLANWGYKAAQIYQGADDEAVQEFPRNSQP